MSEIANIFPEVNLLNGNLLCPIAKPWFSMLTCISEEHRCDGTENCLGGVDELDCGCKCVFRLQ